MAKAMKAIAKVLIENTLGIFAHKLANTTNKIPAHRSLSRRLWRACARVPLDYYDDNNTFVYIIITIRRKK